MSENNIATKVISENDGEWANGFSNLWLTGSFYDVELSVACAGKQKSVWKCHSAILASHSIVLKEEMLKLPVEVEKLTNNFIRKLTITETLPECIKAYPQLIEYFYRDKL